ncbi:MAG: SIMPL domain-containing protein [Patescibacteria group bacterium]|jgi:hypothetical protein
MLSEQNQKTINLALYVLVGLMLVAGVLLLVKTYYTIKPQPTNLAEHTITLSATGDAVAVPDVARITLSVLQEGDTVADVVNAGNSKMNDILKALKEQGLEEKDLKTTAYNLTPRYNYEVQPYKIEKYQLEQAVQVTVRDFTKLSDVVAQATAAGANSVGTPTFEVEDAEAVKSEARQEALARAKQKAEDLAKASGVKLGRLVSFAENEGTASSPEPYPTMRGAADTIAPTFQAGDKTVSTTVSVTFELK